ncbi:MAG: hypothetical protein R3D55_11415 [Chloroflexota bacterium]
MWRVWFSINIQRVIGTNTILGQIIPWLAASLVVYDQSPLLAADGNYPVKVGTTVKLFAIWRENLWAVPINIIILSVGVGHCFCRQPVRPGWYHCFLFTNYSFGLCLPAVR